MYPAESLVDRIYEAAIEPVIWPHLLTDIARSVNAEGGVVAVRNDGCGWSGYQVSGSLAKRLDECIRSDTAQRSIQTPRLLAARRRGFASDDELFSEQEFSADPWTTEWAAHNRVFHGAATAIRLPAGELLVVQIMRRAGAPGLDQRDLARLDALRPHLARAGFLAARWRLQRMRAVAEALAMVGLPAAIIDLTGRVLAANALIQAMTAHVIWRPCDHLALTDAAATDQLRTAVRDLDKPTAASVRSFPARSSRTGESVVVHVIPARRSAREVFDGGFGVLAVTPVTSPAPPESALIEALFDLTPAEARVARGIVAGQTTTEMAATHKVAHETIRTQVKAVLAKTGARRQAEAAAKLATLPKITPIRDA